MDWKGWPVSESWSSPRSQLGARIQSPFTRESCLYAFEPVLARKHWWLGPQRAGQHKGTPLRLPARPAVRAHSRHILNKGVWYRGCHSIKAFVLRSLVSDLYYRAAITFLNMLNMTSWKTSRNCCTKEYGSREPKLQHLHGLIPKPETGSAAKSA